MLKIYYYFLFVIILVTNIAFSLKNENKKNEVIKPNNELNLNISKKINNINIYPGCYWPWYCWRLAPSWDNNVIYREIINFPEYPSKGSDKKLTLFFYEPDDYNFQKTFLFDFIYDFYNTDDEWISFKYIWYKTKDKYSNVTFGKPLTNEQLIQIKNWTQNNDLKMIISYRSWGYRKECGYDGGIGGPCRYWELNHYFQITDFTFTY